MPPVRPSTDPIVRSVFPILVFFLAAIFSGLLEKIPGAHSLHILTILGGSALIAIGMSGRIQVVARNPIAKSLVLFTAWMIVCIPFGRWPGGSAGLFVGVWSRSFLAFVLVAGCILTIEQCKTIFKTIGYSVGILSIMTLALRGTDKTGRLGLLGTRYENANDFAWTLVLGLSFLGFLIQRGSRQQKSIALFLSAPILLALVKTGSRAGMVGFGMLAFFGFLQASRAARIRLAFAIPLVLILFVAAIPRHFLARYTTIFGEVRDGQYNLSAEERLLSTATGSSEERLQLLKDSIYVTITHPLFGVGPGGFPIAQNDIALERGERRGFWFVTHNTYTQVSSEMGISGLVIYLIFLYQCFKPLNFIVRTGHPGREWEDLRALARSLRASLVVLLTIAMFDAYGYDTNILIMAGLSCALALIAQRQQALLTASSRVTRQAGVATEPALEPIGMNVH